MMGLTAGDLAHRGPILHAGEPLARAAGELGAGWPALVVDEDGPTLILPERVVGQRLTRCLFDVPREPAASVEAALPVEEIPWSAETPFLVVTEDARPVGVVSRAHTRSAIETGLAAHELLTAQVAHDLRNLLHSVSQRLQLALEPTTDTEASVTAAMKGLRRAGDLCARLVRPALPQPRRKLFILPVVEAFVDLIGPAFPEHPLELVTPEEELPPVVADEIDLERILLNLVSNARQATPDGGPIRVELRPRTGEVQLRVGDHGAGVRDEDAATIFSAGVSSRRGGGLGLVVVNRLAQELGGSVLIRDRDGGGTWFEVTLPAV